MAHEAQVRIGKTASLLVLGLLLPLSGCEREKEYCEYDDLTGEVLFCVSMTESEHKRAIAKKSIESIRQAALYYSIEIGQIPTQDQGIDALTAPPEGIDASRYPPHGYLKSIVDDPWGNPFEYVVPASRSEDPFDVYSSGPDGDPNTDDDIGNWN